MDKKEFINKIKAKSLKLCKQYNILPSLMIAQACLESGYGKHAPGNNLFGYKWTKKCGREYNFLWTKEYINGKYVSVQAKFRKYNSIEESLEDYAKLIGTARRYEPVRKCSDYICACKQVKKCGYATGKTYDLSLRKIIEQNSLQLIDEEAKKGKVEEITEVDVEQFVELLEKTQEILKKLLEKFKKI